MKQLLTILAIGIMIAAGSFVGTIVSKPEVTTATKYLPIYNEVPVKSSNGLTVIKLNETTGDMSIKGSDTPLSVQIRRSSKPSKRRIKYITRYIYIKDTTNHIIKQHLYATDSSMADREEQTDSVSHSIQ